MKLKKIILFLLLIVALVGVIFLFTKVIFPAPKLDLAYNKAYEYSLSEDEKYVQENLGKLYSEIYKAQSSNENLSKIQNYEILMLSYERINEKMLSGLLFNQRGKEYNKLAKELEVQYDDMIKEMSEAKSYMKDTFFNYTQLNPDYQMNDLSVYVTTMMRNLDEAIESQYNFYNTLMAIYGDSSKPSLQNNKMVIINVSLCDKMFDKVYSSENYSLSAYTKLSLQCMKNFEDRTFLEANEIATICETINIEEMAENYLKSTLTSYLSAKTEAHRTFASKMFGV